MGFNWRARANRRHSAVFRRLSAIFLEASFDFNSHPNGCRSRCVCRGNFDKRVANLLAQDWTLTLNLPAAITSRSQSSTNVLAWLHTRQGRQRVSDKTFVLGQHILGSCFFGLFDTSPSFRPCDPLRLCDDIHPGPSTHFTKPLGAATGRTRRPHATDNYSGSPRPRQPRYETLIHPSFRYP